MEGLRSYAAKRVYETLRSILFPLILAFSPFEVLHSNFSRPLQISSLLISDILSSYCNQFEFKRKFFKNEIMQISNLPAVHFRRLSRLELNLHALLHAFTSLSERLVVGFDASNNPDIQKLQNKNIFK